MHLKRLHLTGFKTFAEKTEIEFSRGVTAIVGPNGSGKSNIADAVLWVLGEQKASAVRGTKSQDVIFAGSAKRKPLGLAEVSLTVDNSDRTLPLGFDEITITRRAYRSGEGEYFLNKAPCRLKDIYELFLDTGVGREAYALVNQSGIDAVLSADPETRRGLFEEAAGIKKYRVRKREALKKLEAAEANLTRVRDILSEIDDQMEPLRGQAEQATRYLSLKERLQQIECDHLIVQLRLADYEATAAKETRLEEETQLAAQNGRLAAAESRARDLASLLAQAEPILEACRERHQSALSALEQERGRRELALQRRESLAAQIALLAQEIGDLDERLARATSQAQADSADLAAARAEEEKLAHALAEREAAVKTLDAQIALLARKEEEVRARSAQRDRDLSDRRAELARIEARIAEAEGAIPTLKDEADRANSRRQALSAALDLARNALADAKSAQRAAEERLKEAQAAQNCALGAVQSAAAEHDKLRGELLSLATRRRSLMELEDAQEGYFAGVRAVVQAAQRRKIAGEFVVVADAFTAPPGYEVAFEVALASSLQDIITDSEASARGAIEYLKSARAGRATFLPLDRMRPVRADLRLDRVRGSTGYCGTALDILDFDEKYRPALEVLLGRVLVCETLEHALRVSSQSHGWNRIVTLAGELLLPTGALTGGSLSRKAAPLLERKTEIAVLAAKIAASETLKAKHCDTLSTLKAQAEEASACASRAQQDVSAASLAAGGARQDVERAEREIYETDRRLEEYGQRLRSAETAVAQMREKAALCAGMLAEKTATSVGDPEEDVLGADRLRRLMAERDEVRSEITRMRIERAGLSERAIGLARSERLTRASCDEIETARTRRREREAAAREDLGRLSERASGIVQAEQAAQAICDKSREELEAAQLAYRDLRAREHEASAGVRLIGEMRAAALERIRRNELAEARADMQRTQLAARLLEEYDVAAEYALSLDRDPEVPLDTPREVTRLRRDLRSLGEVNTGAAEEYARLSERQQFLTEQKADMEEAKAKIAQAIREIDESTRDVFLEAFDAVGNAFDEIFKRLFDGGGTQLALTHPEDLLETGVEIIAQPPGKKKQNLSLLSGGERALTAAALLFAFLKVRPAPFCVLDEVDAPLDGANVERFADLLRDFGRDTQFLVITHNPTTMEAAPIWYGVTMQEPGISRILSLHVPALEAA